MDNNNLVSGNEYIINYNNNPNIKYLGTYETTILSNIEKKPNYVFKNVYKVYSETMKFPVNYTTVQPYSSNSNTSNSNNSLLGKRETTTVNDNELDAKKSKTDMTFTEEEILKDRKYWESVDGGGKRTRRVKRKSKKNKKSKKRKSRKYNK